MAYHVVNFPNGSFPTASRWENCRENDPGWPRKTWLSWGNVNAVQQRYHLYTLFKDSQILVTFRCCMPELQRQKFPLHSLHFATRTFVTAPAVSNWFILWSNNIRPSKSLFSIFAKTRKKVSCILLLKKAKIQGLYYLNSFFFESMILGKWHQKGKFSFLETKW